MSTDWGAPFRELKGHSRKWWAYTIVIAIGSLILIGGFALLIQVVAFGAGA